MKFFDASVGNPDAPLIVLALLAAFAAVLALSFLFRNKSR
jgi:hypothetical protein